MLDSIEKDNKTISEAYKGDELVWELPTVMVSDINLYAGIQTVVFTTYPSRCNVVVTVNGKEVANGLSSPGGVFTCNVNPSLKSKDNVVIEITKSGWGDLENVYLIY
jgi:hypothetical protein